jgi:hypothetical protein
MNITAWPRAVAEAVAIAVACTVVGFGANAVRPAGLPLVAAAPYDVLVPCPEPGGEVVAIAASDPSLGSQRTFVIDARSAAEFVSQHVAGATNVSYDWLDPVPDESLHDLARRIAASRATLVVVYGDGALPDSGEHLGREIAGHGIRNVAFVRGGAPALFGGGRS